MTCPTEYTDSSQWIEFIYYIPNNTYRFNSDNNSKNMGGNNMKEQFVDLHIKEGLGEFKKKFEHRLNMINEFVHDIATQYDNWNYNEPEDPGLDYSVHMLDKLVSKDSDIRVWVDGVIESKVIKQALNRNKTLTQEQEEFMKMVKEFKYDDPFELSELMDYEEYLNEHPDQAVLRKRQ